MKWREADPYWAVSECGFYTVAKTFDGDGAVYCPFYRHGGVSSSTSGKAADPLGRRKSFKGAAALCVAHAEKASQPQIAA